MTRRIILLGGCILLCGCAVQSRTRLLTEAVVAKPENCAIEVLRTGQPSQDYVQLARLDTHIEATHFVQADFDDALPELKKQACRVGADAIMEIEERKGGYLETRSYHVTATAIAYRR